MGLMAPADGSRLSYVLFEQGLSTAAPGAGHVPARRAMAIDPMVALCAE